MTGPSDVFVFGKRGNNLLDLHHAHWFVFRQF